MSNILEVTFESGQTFATATRLWKGDYGQILLIHGPELPSYYEVHFASTKDGTPEVSVGTPEGVNIPNRLLQAEGYIYAWVFLHVGANDGYTKFQVKIPVEERGIPVDQETPEDQTAVQQAIAALNAETGRAEAAADAAEVSEQNAKASEDAAALSEQNAEDAAQAAAASAENAAISETGAAESEAAAAASAQQAATSAEAAAEYAASAGGSEELVEEYARRAKGSADTAELYGTMAVNAKDVAEAGARSAIQASQAAVSAKNVAETAAQTATQKASEASSSAGVASSQASIAAAEAAAASGYANNAEGSARQAAASAEDAADSADDADDSAASARLHDEQAQAAKVDAQTAAGNASAAQTAAEAAQTAAETAQDGAEDAQDAAEAAQSSAEAAQTAAEAAKTAAQTAQGAAEAAQDAAEDAADQAQEWAESIDPDSFARPDGYYEDMTVGNAEQLVATVGVDDNSPYLFRTTGGSADVGERKSMELVGGTVAFNQLVGISTTASGTQNGITFTNNGDGSWTINGTSSEAGRVNYALGSIAAGLVIGHKYILFGGLDSTVKIGIYGMGVASNGGGIFSYTGDANKTIRLDSSVSVSVSYSNVKIYPQLFDLTQMFGSTIADYIYSLEQAEAGAGVAWFRKLFPKPYYEYNAGELISVKSSSHITTGFNQWDEEWEVGAISETGQDLPADCIRSKNYIPVVAGQQYFYYNSKTGIVNYSNVYFYDSDYNYIGTIRYGVYSPVSTSSANFHNPFTVPNGASFMRFSVCTAYGTTYTNDICFNLHWDGERDGEYIPYESHVYPFASNLELFGIPKLDADDQLYYDGDLYTSDGTVTRKYAVVDLGTLAWQYSSDLGLYSSYSLRSLAAHNFSFLISHKYSADNWTSGTANKPNQSISCKLGTTRDPWVCNTSITEGDTAALKADLSGVYMVYQLDLPTTESVDPFASPEVIDDFGTEQFIDTRVVPIPVGHNSQYQANLRAKLEMAPDSPNTNGDYLLRHTAGQNSYVPYVFPTSGQVAYQAGGNYEAGTVGAKLHQLQGNLEEISVVITNTEVTELDLEVVEDYYYTGGAPHENSAYDYVHITGVEEGDLVICRALSGSSTTRGLRFVDAYKGTTRSAADSKSDSVAAYTVPTDIDNLYVTVEKRWITAGAVFAIKKTSSRLEPKGLSAMTFVDTGKNLCSGDWVDGEYVSQTDGVFYTNSSHMRTDYIPFEESMVFSANTSFDLRYALYNEQFQFISGAIAASPTKDTDLSRYYSAISHESARYIVFSTSTKSLLSAYVQIENGSSPTEYEEYVAAHYEIKPSSLAPGSVDVDIDNLLFAVRDNLFDINDPGNAPNTYLNSGTLSPNTTYYTTAYIKVKPNTDYAFYNGANRARFVNEFNGSYGFISPAYEGVSTIKTSPNTQYIRVTFYSVNAPTATIVEGTVPDPNASYDKKIPSSYIKQDPVLHLYVPSEIFVGVGRTIELYNDLICLEAKSYHFYWRCYQIVGTTTKAIGVQYGRKFSITGYANDVGDYTLNLQIVDSSLNVVAAISSVVHVVADSLSETKNVLPIGDSLTNLKAWLAEVQTLSNNHIHYIGTRGIQSNGYGHEGRSGASANWYLTNSTYTFDNYYIGAEGIDGASNPFWDGSKFSLSHYISVQGSTVGIPDAVQILLGTNGLSIDPQDNTSKIKAIVDAIIAEYPTMPIFVCNTIYRSRQDGYYSSGADGYVGMNTYQFYEDVKIMNLQNALSEAFEDYDTVTVVPLSVCMDREYDFGNVEVAVNPRLSTVTTKIPNESVHPQTAGYLQMADVMYSTYIGVLEDS